VGDASQPADPDIKNVIHQGKIHHRKPIQEASFPALSQYTTTVSLVCFLKTVSLVSKL